MRYVRCLDKLDMTKEKICVHLCILRRLRSPDR